MGVGFSLYHSGPEDPTEYMLLSVAASPFIAEQFLPAPYFLLIYKTGSHCAALSYLFVHPSVHLSTYPSLPTYPPAYLCLSV